MINKCKFEVEVTYNSDYFAEGEIRDTIKKSIKKLNDEKVSKFGRKVICDPGKINSGAIASINTISCASCDSIDLVETLASINDCVDEKNPSMVLPTHRVNELMHEVRSAFRT